MWTSLNIHGHLFLGPNIYLGQEDDPYSAGEVTEVQGVCSRGQQPPEQF